MLPPQPVVRAVPPQDKLFPLDKELPVVAVPEMEALQPLAQEEESSLFSFDKFLQTEEQDETQDAALPGAGDESATTAVTMQAEAEEQAVQVEPPVSSVSASVVVAVVPTITAVAPSLAPLSPVQTPVDTYHVQIGAFSQRMHAKEAAAALEQHDFRAVVLPLLREDSTLWRVRAAGFATRAAAAQAQAALVQQGYADAQVVAAEEAEEASAAAPPTNYRLRVGVYREAQHARRAADAIEQAGGVATLQTLHRDGVEMTRVLATELPTEAEAKRLQQALQAAGYADTVMEAVQ